MPHVFLIVMFRSPKRKASAPVLYSPTAPNTSSEESDVEQKILELNRMGARAKASSEKNRSQQSGSDATPSRWRRVAQTDEREKQVGEENGRQRREANTSSESDSESGSSTSSSDESEREAQPPPQPKNHRTICKFCSCIG